MGAKSSFFKGLISNQAIESVPVFNKLLPQGNLGFNDGRNQISKAYYGVRADKSRIKGYKQRAAEQDKNLAEAVALNEKGVTSDEMLAAQRTAFEGKKDRYLQRVKDNENRINNLAQDRGGMVSSGVAGMAKGVGGYFAASDMRGLSGRAMTAAVRTGTAGAAYMGANAGLRYLSGGGLTYNNQGERDIAGIPFI